MNLNPFLICWIIIGFLVTAANPQKKEVCYDEIGCFSLEPPWASFMRRLPAPQSPEKLILQFYLATRNTLEKSFEEWKIITTDFYKPSLNSLKDLDYQSSRKRTVVHVNGMYESNGWDWRILKRMATAYLHKEDANIIFVKYNGQIQTFPNFYAQLVADCRVIGAIAARFLEQLIELTHLSKEKIHIIGFSIGAHIVGYIGKRITNIHRITGLDPAKLYFENADPMYRLNDTDAQLVDVLHTNTIPYIPFGGLGYRPPFGGVDFYFNNALIQPGCVLENLVKVLKRFLKFQLKRAIITAYFMYACSHLRVVDYWVESLENSHCTYWGIESGSRTPKTTGNQINMNITTQHKAAPVGLNTFEFVTFGQYYVPTKSESPFCIPKYDMVGLIQGPMSFSGFSMWLMPKVNETEISRL